MIRKKEKMLLKKRIVQVYDNTFYRILCVMRENMIFRFLGLLGFGRMRRNQTYKFKWLLWNYELAKVLLEMAIVSSVRIVLWPVLMIIFGFWLCRLDSDFSLSSSDWIIFWIISLVVYYFTSLNSDIVWLGFGCSFWSFWFWIIFYQEETK